MTTPTILDLDLKCENSANVMTDSFTFKDNDYDYIRPDYTPFFKDGFSITDVNGQILTEGTDFEFAVLIPKLVLDTGKDVYGYIKVLDSTLPTRTPLTIVYHSLGINHPTRAMLDAYPADGIENTTTIDYQTQILGLPDSFPALPHGHDLETELAGWDELTNRASGFVNYKENRSLGNYQDFLNSNTGFWANINLITQAMRAIS